MVNINHECIGKNVILFVAGVEVWRGILTKEVAEHFIRMYPANRVKVVIQN